MQNIKKLKLQHPSQSKTILTTFPMSNPQRSQTEVAKFYGLSEYAIRFGQRRELDRLGPAQWRAF